MSATIEHLRTAKYRGPLRTEFVCADGFRMSIQASSFHYCTPRTNIVPAQRYIAVELGYPSEPEPLIAEYAEDPDAPTATVYGYVPVSVVDAVIAKHGGAKK